VPSTDPMTPRVGDHYLEVHGQKWQPIACANHRRVEQPGKKGSAAPITHLDGTGHELGDDSGWDADCAACAREVEATRAHVRAWADHHGVSP